MSVTIKFGPSFSTYDAKEYTGTHFVNQTVGDLLKAFQAELKYPLGAQAMIRENEFADPRPAQPSETVPDGAVLEIPYSFGDKG